MENKMKNALYGFAYFYFLLCLHLPIEASELKFSQISSRNGLSQNTVRAIAEDRNGFIWAGTLDGLNKYDGYNIRSYRHRIGNHYSLKDHRILELFVDTNGYVWAKTYMNEISCYDPLSDSFLDLKNSNKEPYLFGNYYESSSGDIWLWDKNEGALRLRNTVARTFDQKVFLQTLPSWKNYHFLFEDSQANIWIGGSTGLYQISGDEMITHQPNGKNYVYTNAVELNNTLYFATDESVLVIFNRAWNRFEEVSYEVSKKVWNVMTPIGANKILLFSDTREVFLFNTLTREFEKPEWTDDSDFTDGVLSIHFIIDNKKGIWITNNKGFVWYCLQGEDHFRKKQLSSDDYFTLNRVYVDSSGLIWLTTYGSGLFTYHRGKDEFTNYRNDLCVNCLSSDYLLSIVEDRFGNIWLGSEYAGIIRAVKTPDYIRVVRPEQNTIVGKVNNVRTIFEDSQGNIWVGAKNGSLYVYNQELTEHTCIGEDINPYSLMEDDKQRMWVGTKNNGVYLYDIKSFRCIDNMSNRKEDPASLSHNTVFHIMKDHKGRIWIATFGGGINLAKENDQMFTFRSFVNNKGNQSRLRYLHQDSKEMIWAGSNDGLMRFDPDELIHNPQAYRFHTMDFNQEYSLSSNDIKMIYEDADSTIWVGTASGGLNKYMEATDNFLSFDYKDGMADNYVLGIMEHGDHLWISSENGLSKFNKKDYSVATYQFSQKTFGNIFNEGAFCLRKDGMMMWGNLDGILALDPERFTPDKQITPVLITGLQINGMEWNDLKKDASEKSITFMDKITLSHKQHTFSIEFAMLALRNPDKNRYAYILDNYDSDWSVQASDNTATYRNLPYGKYVFRVKGANADGEWSQDTTALSIIIKPPIWRTTWAYLFYFILLCTLLYVVFRVVMNFNRIKNEIEVEKQLTNHKLRFFTNISHEFCTPITLIQSSIENLNKHADLPASVNKQLGILNRNSTDLRHLIDQLLEFRKLQNNVLRLDLEELDIVSFANNIFNGFQHLAEQKTIHYTFQSSIDALHLYIDRKKVDKIIYNLLSNAFKFTPKGGSIELSISRKEAEQTCCLTVKDNGIGVPKEKQHLLFNRFSTINYTATGAGIGLSLAKEFIEAHKGKIYFRSNPGGGSIFTVELATQKEIYAGENFVSSHGLEEKAPIPMTPSFTLDETIIDRETFSDYQLLIIEDNDAMRNFLKDEFLKYLSVDTAEDGKIGLQKAIETNPDLIICDVMLPEMDGYEVTRRLKGEFQTCHIPVILLTAHASIENRLEGVESGADAYITKPFNSTYVVKRVMKLIEQREMLKKCYSKDFILHKGLVSTDKDKIFFEKVEKILEENFRNSNFTIDRFFELSGVRRTLFFRKVKSMTGFSPNEMIKIRRLKESARLLQKEDLTVSEVSYKVGFEDPYYFSKCFKSHFGKSPSQYQKESQRETKTVHH
jgi:signal transduction histidine kinase/ligand-binding sensor domain-containing protein/DNA-binding response OmpR family regulator